MVDYSKDLGMEVAHDSSAVEPESVEAASADAVPFEQDAVVLAVAVIAVAEHAASVADDEQLLVRHAVEPLLVDVVAEVSCLEESGRSAAFAAASFAVGTCVRVDPGFASSAASSEGCYTQDDLVGTVAYHVP